MVTSTPLRQLLRLPDVRAATALKTTKIYELIRRGEFPPPIKRGRSSFWVGDEVAAVNAAIIGGSAEADIKALVAELVAARAQGQASSAGSIVQASDRAPGSQRKRPSRQRDSAAP